MKYQYRQNAIPKGETRFFSVSDLASFRTFLEGYCVGDDFYARSPLYHLVTGRLGNPMENSKCVCVYTFEKAGFVYYAHPNLDGVLCLFYVGEPALFFEIANRFIDEKSKKLAIYDELRLCRVSEDLSHIFKNVIPYRFNKQLKITAVEEDTLDWKYPSHTISTEMMSELSGQRYKSIRRKVNRFKRLNEHKIIHGISRSEIMNLCDAWFTQIGTSSEDEISVINYYLRMYELWRNNPNYCEVTAVKVDNRVRSFSFWSGAALKDGNGVCIGLLADLDIVGLSEFQHHVMCLNAKQKNLSGLCIGGSEGSTLDAFKRKMIPTHSKVLNSAILSL